MDENWVEHERSRVRAYAEQASIASVMNDTKWREVCSAFQKSGFRYRVKDLLCETPGAWDGEWHHHPLPYFGIEWLEIAITDPKWTGANWVQVDHSEEISSVLNELSVPFSRETEAIRVWGYIRPGAKPEFEKF